MEVSVGKEKKEKEKGTAYWSTKPKVRVSLEWCTQGGGIRVWILSSYRPSLALCNPHSSR